MLTALTGKSGGAAHFMLPTHLIKLNKSIHLLVLIASITKYPQSQSLISLTLDHFKTTKIHQWATCCPFIIINVF